MNEKDFFEKYIDDLESSYNQGGSDLHKIYGEFELYDPSLDDQPDPDHKTVLWLVRVYTAEDFIEKKFVEAALAKEFFMSLADRSKIAVYECEYDLPVKMALAFGLSDLPNASCMWTQPRFMGTWAT